jgi:tetratricopeptide (TPR) repeat protein
MLGRAVALFVRTAEGGEITIDRQAELLQAALPLEDELGDPRRLALLWELRGYIANFRMRNEEDVEATLNALRYHRLAGDSPSDTHLEWALLLSPRPAENAMRMVDELAELRPPGACDLPRAALLAMRGRFDEAWPLAEARSRHLREISNNSAQDGHCYLWLIATIEGDRERACRHNADMIEILGSGSVAAAFRSFLASDLCYLGRLDEAESVLRQAQAVPARASVRVMAPSAEALLLAARDELERAETLARTAVTRAENETDNVWFQAWTNTNLATVLERAGRVDRARAALERAFDVWERKGCLPLAARVREQIASLDATAT